MIQMEGDVVDLKPIGCMCNLFIIIKNKNKKFSGYQCLWHAWIGGDGRRRGKGKRWRECIVYLSILVYFTSSLLLSSSPISFFANIGIGWQESSWNAFLGNWLRV